jgi:hypothetical protein
MTRVGKSVGVAVGGNQTIVAVGVVVNVGVIVVSGVISGVAAGVQALRDN